MIVFDLVCAGDHRFEAWFASRQAFDDQRERALLLCPQCGTSEVDRALSVPRIGGTRTNAQPSPQTMLTKIAALQASMLEKSSYVGTEFATKARAIAEGREPDKLIHGQATAEEARSLSEDGIAVMPLLVPFVPPEQRN